MSPLYVHHYLHLVQGIVVYYFRLNVLIINGRERTLGNDQLQLRPLYEFLSFSFARVLTVGVSLLTIADVVLKETNAGEE